MPAKGSAPRGSVQTASGLSRTIAGARAGGARSIAGWTSAGFYNAALRRVFAEEKARLLGGVA